MLIVNIAMSEINDWETFHDTFAEALGFPDFYGRNMNAWIDRLTYEDDGMSAFPVEPGDVLALQLQDCNDFRVRCQEIYEALIDAAAFVNWRRIEQGDRPILALLFH
jgi:RNAse (barnase) inhibitor barstar